MGTNQLLLEISRINEIIYSSVISEQKFGMPTPNITSNVEGLKDLGSWFKSWDEKDWLALIEVTSGILGAIPSPVSPVLLGISIGAGIANAKIYYDEGDPYTAGLNLTFTLLGAGTLAKILKNSKIFTRLGKNGSVTLLNKVKSGTATNTEKKLLTDLLTEIKPVTKELSTEVAKQTTKKILSQLPKQSLKFILKLCMGMFKLGVFGIKGGIVISGTFLTYDKIYKALNYKNEKNLSVRDKNELFKLHNFIFNNEEEIKKSLISNIQTVEPEIIKHAQEFINVDTTYQPKF